MNWTLQYRPNTFDKIVGNQKAVKELKKRIVDNNIPKVIMLSGKTGCGKTTLAFIYIKALLCENKKEDGNPCNECKYCKMVDAEIPSENVSYYNGSNMGIEEMRMLEEKCSKKVLGNNKKKIICIDEMQEIPNVRAQKNILKILEKTNDNTYFILGTMDKSKIDKAIVNRCLVYNLSLEGTDILNYLQYIYNAEKINMDSNQLLNIINAIITNCDGSLRTAIGMFERVYYSDIKDEQELYKELGILSDKKIVDFINGLLKGDINILQIKPDATILEQIKLKLVLLFEYSNGMELNAWQKGQLNGINKFDNKILSRVLTILNELAIYPYVSPSMIEFQLVKCIMEVKEIIEFTFKLSENKPIRGRN